MDSRDANILLVGHSFIRRFKNFMVPQFYNKDIVCGMHDHAAGQFAVNLRIDTHYQKIYTFSHGLTSINQLPWALESIRQTNPIVTVIDIGSNDLANLTTYDPNQCLILATATFNFAESLTQQGISVILHGIIPRRGRIDCSYEVFLDNSTYYNKVLKLLCEDASQIHFHKLRGFHNPMDIHCSSLPWSLDNIHCNSPSGRRKYQAQLRHGLLLHHFHITN